MRIANIRQQDFAKAMPHLGASQRCGAPLIEPGKPNQNAYVESVNGRLRDECLNEHWLICLTHARTVIELRTWKRHRQ